MRRIFFITCFILILLEAWFALYHPSWLWSLIIILPLMLIGIYDLVQRRHTVLRNFPVLGHIRYLSEFIGPELRQYFVETNTDGRPFTRLQRNYVYTRAKHTLETHPFGTELDVYKPGYYWLAHSMFPRNISDKEVRVKFGGPMCTQPYMASLFNISAMSFGSLGMNAISALNKGASIGHFFQNTGEGGISDYHMSHGGDLVFQIGTAYFGCRDEEGNFSEKYFSEAAQTPQVKMIELKLSQGAKPGLGGVLPALKNTEEIARIRKLTPHKMVHSPPAHQTFSDAAGLLRFIARLRELSGGKPVGFKTCIGSRKEFTDICDAMHETGIYPDFITVDGGEGGTGAAPIEFSDNVGMPLDEALVFVCDALRGYAIKQHIRVIASGKIISGFDIIKHLAIGADCCNCARGMMFALGCIQALKCDENNCPTGIATHRRELQAGLDIESKGDRVASYHKETVKSAMALLSAAGLENLSDLNRSFIYKRVDEQHITTLEQIFPTPEIGSFLHKGKAESGEPGRSEKSQTGGNPPQKAQGHPGDYPNKTKGDNKHHN